MSDEETLEDPGPLNKKGVASSGRKSKVDYRKNKIEKKKAAKLSARGRVPGSMPVQPDPEIAAIGIAATRAASKPAPKKSIAPPAPKKSTKDKPVDTDLYSAFL